MAGTRKGERNVREIQRKYKGNAKEILGKCKGISMRHIYFRNGQGRCRKVPTESPKIPFGDFFHR